MYEDVYVAGKMYLNGWKIVYIADAQVFHSHNYSLWQYFKFSFDIGVFHAMNPWVKQNFTGFNQEGVRYLKDGIALCLRKKHYFALLSLFMSVGLNFIGYNLGRLYSLLPKRWCKFCSLCSFYWDKSTTQKR